MHTSLANFLKIWSNCGYWKSPKEKLVLSTFYFSISHSGSIYIYIYIYIYTAKKKVLGALSWTTHPLAPSLAMVPPAPFAGNGPDDRHGSRGEQFVSCPPRLACEAPQVPQPLAPSSRFPLLRDYLSRQAEVWWSRPRSPTYRHPGAPPPPPASCCFHIPLLAPCYFACWT